MLNVSCNIAVFFSFTLPLCFLTNAHIHDTKAPVVLQDNFLSSCDSVLKH